MKKLIVIFSFLLLAAISFAQFPTDVYAEIHPVKGNTTIRTDMYEITAYDNNRSTMVSNDTLNYQMTAGYQAKLTFVGGSYPDTYKTHRMFKVNDLCVVRFKLWDTFVSGYCTIIDLELNDVVVTVTVEGVRYGPDTNNKLLKPK